MQADPVRDLGKQLSGMGELLGHVIGVRGSQATVGLRAAAPQDAEELRVTVGKFLGIRAGKSLLIGVITDVSLRTHQGAREQGYTASADIDVLGEIQNHESSSARFQRGVTAYPAIGDPAALIGSRELRLIFDISAPTVIDIGHIQQDSAIGAYLNANDMLSKHFAVLGTTGVGKSSAVALILQQILKVRPDLRLFLLDVHNEYGRCFGEQRAGLSPRNLKLPFWLFNFEEIVDVFFGGRPGVRRRDRDPRRGHSARQGRLHPIPRRRPGGDQAERSEHRLHGRHAGALPPRRPDRARSTTAWASSRTARRG